MKKTNVLIVEDERIIARGIEKTLKSLGYNVVGSYGTAEEALQALQKISELIPDIVLMDIHLGPGMDGIEAAAQVRKDAGLPVVFLTAHSDQATLQRAKLTEPFGYVLKPYDDKDLHTAIEIGLYRHKMERQLLENERWLAATLGSIGDGVIATDESGHVRFMNALACEMTGWTAAEAHGKDIREVFHIVEEASRQLVQNPLLQALELGQPVLLAPGTLLIDRAGNERPIDDSAAPIHTVGGLLSGGVLVFRDITERRRLEDHLRQAQKMEALGRLAGGIAHDFNNIMTIITGMSELLLLDDHPAAQRREYLQSIHAAGARAAALTQQIMAFSRKQILVPSILNFNTVLRDMGAMVKRLIGSNIEFHIHLAPDVGQINADPTQIGQVILNLAANARDAMPHGGQFSLSTHNVELGPDITRDHPDVPAGPYVMLAVRDTGHGIPPDVITHIFEPFYTTKGLGQGTGLGLATVYGIVKQSGGHIEVSSSVGQGTTFRIYLPRVEAPPPPPAPISLPQVVSGTETLLLVEDEPSVRSMVRLVLTQCGYTVLDAANGLDAIYVANNHSGPIHLLITDLVMPKLSGREVADHLRATRPYLRVLFMSGYTEDVIIQQGIESASVDFLPKPFTITTLTSLTREILDRS